MRELLEKEYFLGDDFIWRPNQVFSSQETEIEKRRELLRDKLEESAADILTTAARHYSIPIMRHEVRRFLNRMPDGAVILDIGGGVGWHWMELASLRPDIRVVLVDFVWENLYRARALFPAEQFNQSIYLVNGNALDLKLPSGIADGYWSVQCLQHIPDYAAAIKEAHRVLKPGGVFVNYSLNNQWLVRMLYRLFGKNYPVKSQEERYYLARACQEQRGVVEDTFKGSVTERLSEVIFSPELYFRSPGRENSLLGALDSALSNNIGLFGFIARQRSYEAVKTAA